MILSRFSGLAGFQANIVVAAVNPSRIQGMLVLADFKTHPPPPALVPWPNSVHNMLESIGLHCDAGAAIVARFCACSRPNSFGQPKPTERLHTASSYPINKVDRQMRLKTHYANPPL
jgi:hypothetical protein